ncbi:MAG TPA: cellulose biosynthesis cyclic di-GMP-binding regulatory protein BcsB [Candidatus Angelobacter sp.]|nr:cellulose biosynthesis cyclic di-GMP-binding regulatory protein BcsB [Candidatus Angelobacter sp.]
MHNKHAGFFLFCATLISSPLTGQPAGSVGREGPAGTVESISLPLIRTDQEQFSGDWAVKDFFVRFPEHIGFRGGGELRLALYPTLEVLSRLCTINASLNGKRLSGATVEGKNLTNINDIAIRVRFPVPDGWLAHGWNRVTVGFILKKPDVDPGAAPEPGTWTIRQADSFLTTRFERLPLFPELLRFPGSLGEEKLLHAGRDSTDPKPITVTVLFPAKVRAAHLRACAVIGARLGQTGYMDVDDCRVAPIEDWQTEMRDRNGLIVGLKDEVASVSVPPDVTEKLGSLRAGQGLIAEFIQGVLPDQHRWLLVAGADDDGLEKAVLTLGSAAALESAPPNPIVIDTTPAVSPELEAIAQPGATRVFLKDLGVRQIRLSGIHTSEQSISGWRLPPGFELSSGVLHLRFNHSTALLIPGSSLEMLVNGIKAGTVELAADTAAAGFTDVSLPGGLSGRDPMTLTFRARLDVASVECDARKEEEPWVAVSGDSELQTTPSLTRVQDLSQAGRLLLRDSFLRRAAFLVPENPSREELRWLLAVSMTLGKQLPSSPVLWPEVCTYSKTSPPPVVRLADRSVVLLGAVGQWDAALPPESPVLVTITDEDRGSARMQGREVNIAAFEPTLTFMQMMTSPWSRGELLVAAGGWREFTTPTLLRMLTAPEAASQLHGNVCAMDALGRVAAYDTRNPARDSLAERIQNSIPAGLSVEETQERLAAQMSRLRGQGRANTIVFYTCGVLFILIVGCRFLFMWERAHLLKQASVRQHSIGEIS